MGDFCVVHAGNGQTVRHSLALRREKGKWVTTPCCLKCRAELVRQAKVAGKFVPFYGIEQSEAEASKRNEEGMKFQPFLAKFAKSKPQKEAPRPAKVKVLTKPEK